MTFTVLEVIQPHPPTYKLYLPSPPPVVGHTFHRFQVDRLSYYPDKWCQSDTVVS